jgi:two-component system sensor histidine kinase DegS
MYQKAQPSKSQHNFYLASMLKAEQTATGATSMVTEDQILLRERKRLARDLHDGVIQRLTHTLHKLEIVQYLIHQQKNDQAQQEIANARDQLLTSLQELRRSIDDLSPPQMPGQSLLQAISALLDEQCETNPDITITSSIDENITLPHALEIPIYRLLQEALTNIHKHAQATRANVTLRTRYGLLIVEVSDNGIGFEVKEFGPEHMGLRNMRDRVREVGGVWEIFSKHGTTVRACFPLLG